MKKVNFLDIILVLFAVLFVYAAASKLITYEEFKTQIAKSPLLMNQGWWIPWMVPTIEIAIGILLFIPRFQLLALFSSFFIMFAFTIYIGFMLAFTPDLPCSCGGILSNLGWKEHLVFNIIFNILAVIGIILLNRQRRMESLNSDMV